MTGFQSIPRCVQAGQKTQPRISNRGGAPEASKNLVAGRSAVTTCLVQEPGPAFSFVDPDLEQAGGGNVAMLFADIVDFTQARRQVLVVVAQWLCRKFFMRRI